jgi:hypothetical protein
MYKSGFGMAPTIASGGAMPNGIAANGFEEEALKMLLRGTI